MDAVRSRVASGTFSRVSLPVAVLGAGSFGTCLAMLCSRNGEVRLWTRNPAAAEWIDRERCNPRHLSDLQLADNVKATSSLESALRGAELVLVAVPSHSLRGVLEEAAAWIEPGAIVLSCAKGIEFETGLLMHQVMEEVLPPQHQPRIAGLSGPSFAREIAERRPTVVTVACREVAYAIAVQTTLSCPWFRCYSSNDMIGVEVGGALKNVVAIAVGMSDGMGMGTNTRAALMTRGLAEITRLAVAMGGKAETLGGLSGMGDLVLTCTGDLSRNRRVGLGLGEGRELEALVEEIGEVAEGIRTTRAACRLAKRLGVELPIAEHVRQVLDGEMSPKEAGRALMTRQLGSES
ncbi:MAG: NAD(P)H-dependent glycerol-3-phosphate dehydrogenase [Myxococcota bacterium]|nr:NAD(P)H-dependent glycerol-3-phosphate dehydrogenase [Myxococcota bacterium]